MHIYIYKKTRKKAQTNTLLSPKVSLTVLILPSARGSWYDTQPQFSTQFWVRQIQISVTEPEYHM